MSRKFQKSAVAVAVLALALVLATPAHAAGLSSSGVPTLLHQAWQWIVNVLPGGALTTSPNAGIVRQKSGPGVDPNGVPAAPPTGSGNHTDFMAGVDPNG